MSQRFEGHNIDEALQNAAEALGVERYQLTYHVLLEKRGFLGGVKRIVIEAEVNAAADAAPPPTAPAEKERYAAPPAAPRRQAGDRGGPRQAPTRGGAGESGSGRGGRGGGRGGAGIGAGQGGRSRGRGRDRGGRGPGRERGGRAGRGDVWAAQEVEETPWQGEIPEQGAESEGAAAVRSWCDEALRLAKVNVTPRTEENDERILVRFFGGDGKLLVAQNGELLDALQVLVNKAMIGRKVEKDIELDCEAFKDRRAEELGQRALEIAERVRQAGKEELLPAMTPIERRIVHLALHDHKEVMTESRGDGFFKRIAVVPRPAGAALESEPPQPES